jgi:hypothetical protein
MSAAYRYMKLENGLTSSCRRGQRKWIDIVVSSWTAYADRMDLVVSGFECSTGTDFTKMPESFQGGGYEIQNLGGLILTLMGSVSPGASLLQIFVKGCLATVYLRRLEGYPKNGQPLALISARKVRTSEHKPYPHALRISIFSYPRCRE